MAKVIIDHLDGPVGKDLFEWAGQFDSCKLPEDMEKDIDLLVEKMVKEFKDADK